jgi:hypothetical protein
MALLQGEVRKYVKNVIFTFYDWPPLLTGHTTVSTEPLVVWTWLFCLPHALRKAMRSALTFVDWRCMNLLKSISIVQKQCSSQWNRNEWLEMLKMDNHVSLMKNSQGIHSHLWEKHFQHSVLIVFSEFLHFPHPQPTKIRSLHSVLIWYMGWPRWYHWMVNVRYIRATVKRFCYSCM